MKFKTLRTSETGKKFQEIEAKMDLVSQAVKVLANELGVEKWRPDRWAAFGGMEFVYFKDEINPDPKIWKEGCGGLQPKRNTKGGKVIYEKMKSLPVVTRHELNKCIGFEEAPFKTIGASFNHPEYILFNLRDDWKCDIPDDCEEITVTEYKQLCEVLQEA